MERPDLENCSDEQASKWYWSKFHDTCMKCKKKCKQSHVVIQVICNNFEGVN